MKYNRPERIGLFILHEGIGSTIFVSQVLQHAVSMKEMGFDLQILSFNTNLKARGISINNLALYCIKYPNIEIALKMAMNIYLPFSLIVNLILMTNNLVKGSRGCSFIHARANYSAFLSILTKPFHKLPVLWDCRGDSIDELKDALNRKNIFIYLYGVLVLLPFDYLMLMVNRKFADATIYVSEKLKLLNTNQINQKNVIVIPCLVPDDKFFFSEDIRDRKRKEMNIGKDEIIFLYSGSLIAYQALDLQKSFYKKVIQQVGTRILIMTAEVSEAISYFSNFPQNRMDIINVSYEEMNDYYNLADFSVLLREAKRLNQVASPTKFGEYCMSGLPVVMNDTVQQATYISKVIKNYVNYKDLPNKQFSLDERREISNKAKKYFSRNNSKYKYADIYNKLCDTRF